MKKLRILFIGNSHTYCNDMPYTVRKLAEEAGYECDVTMLVHGGWYLEQHAAEPQTKFNILYGKYDYVVLQEFSHSFPTEEKYRRGLEYPVELIRQVKANAVIYGTWAQKNAPEKQAEMNRINRAVAESIGAIIAPVGENWWAYIKAHPEIEMYNPDGSHASAHGSAFAAGIIWDSILKDAKK